MADDLFANGIFADTGEPLSLPEEDAIRRFAAGDMPGDEKEPSKYSGDSQTQGRGVQFPVVSPIAG
jgi:hypothetical protein